MKLLTGIFFMFFSVHTFAQLSGYVRDNYSLPVENAKMRFVDEQDTSLHYETFTNSSGYYYIDLTSAESIELKTTLFQASPNPFYYQTDIAFSLDRTSKVTLSIYNLKGQQIRILENATLPAERYIYTWDGCRENGTRVSAGLYLVTLEAGGQRFTQKVILVPSAQVASTGTFYELKSLTVNTYKVIVTAANADTLLLRNVVVPASKIMDFNLYKKVAIPFSTVGNYLGIWNGAGYDQIFIKGVNLGVSVPGTSPGELAATREQYSRWLQMIGDAGFNAIRIYTLHYPRFYQELAVYNNAHPDKPIYLFQGVWLEEKIKNHNFYNYSDTFDWEIQENIDCIHGKRTIAERFGKASGTYDADVSRWTIGFIIGREIAPDEIEMNDFLNSSNTSYEGQHLRLFHGTPTEVWASERLNNLIHYEKTNYKVQRPVSLSSWPTLDPLEHPSEPDSLTDEDKFSIDLNNIDMYNAPAGYFASYHAYPYYPDFINHDPDYVNAKDAEGPNSYLGYLKQLKQHYSHMPLMIAEYGVPSSWGNAHLSTSGMNHGGLNETQQGEMDVRMLKNIKEAECSGGMMFSWIDEWFKRTWLFDPISSGTERRSLWHSIASSEENFGLIAFEPPAPVFQKCELTGSNSKIASAYMAANAEFVSLKLNLTSALSTDSIWIGIDTYKASIGESILPNGAVTDKRAEFALLLLNDSAKLFVTHDYDIFGMWFIRNNSNPEQVFHSTVTNGAPWNLLRLKYSREDSAFQNIGFLKVRKPGETATSLDAVWKIDNEINIRIPWHYLSFTDPSLLLVLNDNRSTNITEKAISDGIALTFSYKKEKATTNRFLWDTWNTAPVTTERIKPGLQIIKKGNTIVTDQPITKKKKGKN